MSISLQGVFKIGEDALTNLFDVNIGTGFPLPTDISIGDLPIDGGSFLRVETVTMPEPTITKYVNDYKTLDIERVSGKMERPKEFTMSVRCDRFYLIYKLFTFWRNQAMDVTTGTMGNDGKIPGTNSAFRIPMTVSPTDAAGGDAGFVVNNAGKVTNWIFYGCFPSAVGAISYDYSSGDKITFDVTMSFLEMREFLA